MISLWMQEECTAFSIVAEEIWGRGTHEALEEWGEVCYMSVGQRRPGDIAELLNGPDETEPTTPLCVLKAFCTNASVGRMKDGAASGMKVEFHSGESFPADQPTKDFRRRVSHFKREAAR